MRNKRPLDSFEFSNKEKPIPEMGRGAGVVQSATKEHEEKPGMEGEGGRA